MMRRMALGMSQEKLATGLGLTFQQVQKYEKGANRMGSSRLQQAADVLGVAAAFFFEGAGGGPYGSAPSPAYIDDFVASEEGLRLAKAFMRLRPAVRRRVVDLANRHFGHSLAKLVSRDNGTRLIRTRHHDYELLTANARKNIDLP
jgi:transcriptional regulator with XRE-family HTH domain